MADIVTNTLQIGNDNLILRDADAQEKVTGLEEDLKQYNSFDWLKPCAEYTNSTHNGITFTWNADNTAVTISGTSIAQAVRNLYHNVNILPEGLEAGKTYYGLFGNTSPYIAFSFIFYNSTGTAISSVIIYTDGTITIPSECVGITIRILVAANRTVNNVVNNIAIISAMTNSQLTDRMAELSGVNERLSDIKNDYKLSCHNILTDFGFPSRTVNGVTFIWNANSRTYTINGTATDNIMINLYYNETALPSTVEPGYTCYIKYTTSNTRCGFRVFTFDSNKAARQDVTFTSDGTYKVRDDAVGMCIRLFVATGAVFSNDTITEIYMTNSTPNGELSKSLAQDNTTITNVAKEVDILNKFNAIDLTTNYVFPYRNENGVVLTWDAVNRRYTINGTTTDNELVNLFYNTTALPTDVKAGTMLSVTYTTTNSHCVLRIFTFNSAGNAYNIKDFSANDTYPVDGDAVGMCIRLFMPTGFTFNNDTVSNISVTNSMTNAGLSESVYAINESNTSLIYSKKDYISVSGEVGGVTFTWSGEKCSISGTPSGVAFTNLFSYANAMPSKFEKGKVYFLNFEKQNADNVAIEIMTYFTEERASNSLRTVYLYESGYFLVPYNCYWIGIRIRVFETTNGSLNKIRIYNGEFPDSVVPKNANYKISNLISFVDDDSTNDLYVSRYYQNCMHNGVVGNYAVLTKQIEDGYTSLDRLIDYENHGFGMLIHCYNQAGDATNYFLPEHRNLQLCRENLATGMRQMQENGFINFNYWVTPYGVHDAEMVKLACEMGMKCLSSYDDVDPNKPFDANRYQIKRISLFQNDDAYRNSLQGVKDIIYRHAHDPAGGWLIVTTHFNSWDGLTYDTTLDSNGYEVGYSRFNEMVQYALTNGCIPVSFAEGFSYIEPYLQN